jgi:hypothetical protein
VLVVSVVLPSMCNPLYALPPPCPGAGRVQRLPSWSHQQLVAYHSPQYQNALHSLGPGDAPGCGTLAERSPTATCAFWRYLQTHGCHAKPLHKYEIGGPTAGFTACCNAGDLDIRRLTSDQRAPCVDVGVSASHSIHRLLACCLAPLQTQKGSGVKRISGSPRCSIDGSCLHASCLSNVAIPPADWHASCP